MDKITHYIKNHEVTKRNDIENAKKQAEERRLKKEAEIAELIRISNIKVTPKRYSKFILLMNLIRFS